MNETWPLSNHVINITSTRLPWLTTSEPQVFRRDLKHHFEGDHTPTLSTSENFTPRGCGGYLSPCSARGGFVLYFNFKIPLLRVIHWSSRASAWPRKSQVSILANGLSDLWKRIWIIKPRDWELGLSHHHSCMWAELALSSLQLSCSATLWGWWELNCCLSFGFEIGSPLGTDWKAEFFAEVSFSPSKWKKMSLPVMERTF